MRQEHLFCAEVYHRLHDLIDHRKRVLFCLDGAAAKEAAKLKHVECATFPDLCFTFAGSQSEIRIEAKIIKKRRVKVGRDQRLAWCAGGTGLAIPHLWIAADESLAEFWLWDHQPFSVKLAQHVTSTGPVLVFTNGEEPVPSDLDELVTKIVAWAEAHGVKPRVQEKK